MSADEFRKNPELVAEMRKILEMPVMKIWLECCQRSSPANRVVIEEGITDTVSNISHGIIKGFHFHHNLFISGGTHPPQSKPKTTNAAMELEPEPE